MNEMTQLIFSPIAINCDVFKQFANFANLQQVLYQAVQQTDNFDKCAKQVSKANLPHWTILCH